MGMGLRYLCQLLPGLFGRFLQRAPDFFFGPLFYICPDWGLPEKIFRVWAPRYFSGVIFKGAILISPPPVLV